MSGKPFLAIPLATVICAAPQPIYAATIVVTTINTALIPS